MIEIDVTTLLVLDGVVVTALAVYAALLIKSIVRGCRALK